MWRFIVLSYTKTFMVSYFWIYWDLFPWEGYTHTTKENYIKRGHLKMVLWFHLTLDVIRWFSKLSDHCNHLGSSFKIFWHLVITPEVVILVGFGWNLALECLKGDLNVLHKVGNHGYNLSWPWYTQGLYPSVQKCRFNIFLKLCTVVENHWLRGCCKPPTPCWWMQLSFTGDDSRDDTESEYSAQGSSFENFDSLRFSKT